MTYQDALRGKGVVHRIVEEELEPVDYATFSLTDQMPAEWFLAGIISMQNYMGPKIPVEYSSP